MATLPFNESETRTNVTIPIGTKLERFAARVTTVTAKKPLQPLPPVTVTGIKVGYAGTAVWSIIAVISGVFPELSSQIGITQLTEISVAGAILGVIGTIHVTRRARRLNLIP
jgi:hypothetical protein